MLSSTKTAMRRGMRTGLRKGRNVEYLLTVDGQMKTIEPSLEAIREVRKAMRRHPEHRLSQFTIFQSPTFPWNGWQRIETKNSHETLQRSNL
jgi:hypothetical protein